METTTRFRIYNLEHVNTLPGGVGMPYDRAIVIDTTRTEPNLISGTLQPVTVYRGDLAGAHAFVKLAELAAPPAVVVPAKNPAAARHA